MNRDEFLLRCGIEIRTLEIWQEQSWLLPEQTGAEITYTEIDVARVRLIQDLRGDFGVNDEGVDVILHLVDQIHGLRRALEGVRKGSSGEG